MSNAIQWIRSLIFNAYMYEMVLIYGVVFLIPAIISSDGAVAACLRKPSGNMLHVVGWVMCPFHGAMKSRMMMISFLVTSGRVSSQT